MISLSFNNNENLESPSNATTTADCDCIHPDCPSNRRKRNAKNQKQTVGIRQSALIKTAAIKFAQEENQKKPAWEQLTNFKALFCKECYLKEVYQPEDLNELNCKVNGGKQQRQRREDVKATYNPLSVNRLIPQQLGYSTPIFGSSSSIYASN